MVSGARDATAGLRAGTGAGLAAVGIWGMAPVATRALVLQLPPLPLLVIRMGVAAVILLPWCGPVLRGPGRQYVPRLIVAGLLGMVGYNLPVTIGLQWVPASTAGLVLASEPVWLLLLAAAFLGERVSRRSWTGAAVALAGVAVLAGPGVLSSRGSSRELAGVSLIALGTLLFAAYTLMLRPLSRACGPVPATAASTVAGSVFYAAFAATVTPDQLGRLPAAAWGELAFLAVGSNVLGMLAWNLAVVRLPGPRAPAALPGTAGQRGRSRGVARRTPVGRAGGRRHPHPGRHRRHLGARAPRQGPAPDRHSGPPPASLNRPARYLNRPPDT